MKSDSLIGAILIAIALLLTLVVLFAPLRAHASLVLNAVPGAYGKPIPEFTAPATVATTAPVSIGSVSAPVMTATPTPAMTKHEQLLRMLALLQELVALMNQLKNS